jgi:hypothetical protein
MASSRISTPRFIRMAKHKNTTLAEFCRTRETLGFPQQALYKREAAQ